MIIRNYLFIVLFAVIAIFPIIKEKGLKINHLGTLVTFVYSIQYGLSSVYILTVPTLYFELKNYVPDISNALIFVVLVLLFFLLGFYSPEYNKNIKNLTTSILKKLPKVNNYEINLQHFPFIIIALEIFGWLSRIILIKMGAYYLVEVSAKTRLPENFNLYSSYLSALSLFPVLCLSLVFLNWLKTNKTIYLVISLILVSLEIAYALPSGMKMKILQPIFNLVLLYSFKKKLPLVPLLLSVGLFMFFVFPYVGIYRSLLLRGDILYDLGVAYDIYKHSIEKFDITSLNETLFYLFGQRMNQVSILSLVVDNTPRVWDFKYGYTYLIFFTAFIPRFFWSNKPSISALGNDFGRDYGIILPSDSVTCVRIPWVVELFLNFGWSGFLAAFVIGFLYQVFYSYFMKNGTPTTFSILLYIIGLFYLVEGESMMSDCFSGIFKIYIIFCFLSYPFLKKIKA